MSTQPAAQHLVYVNGAMVQRDEAKISVFDSAVMLGDTVTESTRTFAHKPFKLEQHIARLYKSLKVTRINPGITPDEMLELSLRILEANLHLVDADEDCWLVHNISRGMSVAGADPTIQRSPATIIIFTSPMILTDWARFYVEGCHAVTPMSRAMPPQALDARIKNRSRMAYTLAEIEVKLVDPQAQGILLDLDGNIAENKGANFFILHQHALLHHAGDTLQRTTGRRRAGRPDHEAAALRLERPGRRGHCCTRPEPTPTSQPTLKH